jgi:hypothetical protein
MLKGSIILCFINLNLHSILHFQHIFIHSTFIISVLASKTACEVHQKDSILIPHLTDEDCKAHIPPTRSQLSEGT